MGSIFRGGHQSGGGSIFRGGGPSGGEPPVGAKIAGGKRKKKGGHSVGGFLGNLGSDIAGTAVGLGPGLYEAGKAIGSDTINQLRHPAQAGEYSPFGGEKSKAYPTVVKPTMQTYEQTYGHGLGQFASEFYKHPLGPIIDALTVADLGTSAAARAGLIPAGRAELLTRSPRERIQGEGPVKSRVTDTKPIVRGRQTTTHALLNKIHFKGFLNEDRRYGKLIRQEATRAGMKELPVYRDYVQATKRLTDNEWAALNIIARDVHPADLAEFWKGKPLEKLVRDPKVQTLAENPSPRLTKAVVAARSFSDELTRLGKETFGLKKETAAARPGKFRATVSESLGRDVEPLHGDPFYVPDIARAGKTKEPFAAFGGGKGTPKITGTAKMNEGILARLGKLDIETDVAGPEFLRRVKLKSHQIVSEELRNAALKLTPEDLDQVIADNGGIPKGWELLRAPVVSKTTGNIRPQKIGYTRKFEGEKQDLSSLIPDPNDLSETPLSDKFGTNDRNLAFYDGEHYFLAPKSMVRSAAGEFHRSSTAVRTLIEKPLTVWRAIILGTRLGFFTNNVVGNNLIYAIRTAGLGGLRAYLNAVKNARGERAVRQLLEDKATPAAVRAQFLREFFPEQIEGTFGATQSPVTGKLVSGRARRQAKTAALGVIPTTQAVAESVPRQALIEVFTRHLPEFKKVYRDMPRQTRSFEQAARKTFADDPRLQTRVSDQVNDALGNYLDLSPVERHTIRNILPFYAWYRAILRITLHLAVDTPGRALALTRLGQIGQEDTENILGDLPSYLKGAIPLGEPSGGEATVLSTQGMNPFATISQLQRGAARDVTELGLNPFLAALIADMQKKERVAPGTLLADIAKATGQGLPPYRAVNPPGPSRLYPHRNRTSELLAQAGLPVKRVRLSEARKRAKHGD